MNNFIRSSLDSKVSDRINKSERAANKMHSFRNKSKDNFIKHTEDQLCFLYNMKDSTMERARERSLKNEMIIDKNIDKFINRENEQKTKYFQSCVL